MYMNIQTTLRQKSRRWYIGKCLLQLRSQGHVVGRDYADWYSSKHHIIDKLEFWFHFNTQNNSIKVSSVLAHDFTVKMIPS